MASIQAFKVWLYCLLSNVKTLLLSIGGPLNSKKKFSSTEHLRSCGTTSSTALISSFLFMFLYVSKFSLVPQGLPGVDHSYEVRGASCTCMCSVF